MFMEWSHYPESASQFISFSDLAYEYILQNPRDAASITILKHATEN